MRMHHRMGALIIALALAAGMFAGCAAAKNVGNAGTDTAPAGNGYPKALIAFAAERQGVDVVDLSDATALTVYVNHCEYGEPAQTITDATVVGAAAEAVSRISVTGGSDGVSSTETYTVFGFQDADGNDIAAFRFQHGMLMEMDGRYPVSGLDALYDVDGIMLADDWDAYWEAEDEKKTEYERAFTLAYPASVFALSGYHASLLASIDPARINYVSIRVGWNKDAGTLDTTDPAVIAAIYDALSAMRAVGKVGEDDPEGQEWSVRFSFQSPDASDWVPKTAYLSFEGDYLLSDLLDGGTEMPYILEGLEALFDCADADVLRYLKEKRNIKAE